jgi:transposase
MFQKESALALWYRARTADSRTGTGKTMIVALARKLVIALWRFVTTGELWRVSSCGRQVEGPGRASLYLLGTEANAKKKREANIGNDLGFGKRAMVFLRAGSICIRSRSPLPIESDPGGKLRAKFNS